MSLTDVASERVILPPETNAPRTEISELQALVLRKPEHLTLSNGEDEVALPEQVIEALRQTLVALARGQAVTIMPTDTSLTTQQAADILGVSRPTIVKILDAGEIPYMTPGRHRRIHLTDVLAYQRRSTAQTDDALDDLMRGSAEYYRTAPRVDDDHVTR